MKWAVTKQKCGKKSISIGKFSYWKKLLTILDVHPLILELVCLGFQVLELVFNIGIPSNLRRVDRVVNTIFGFE